THPDGGTTIVGWYKDATVFRDYQPFTTTPPTHFQNGIDGYRITAPAQSATLLPVDARTFEIPRQVKGGMGQSNIWYADVPESQTTVTAVSTLINGKGLSRKKTKTQAPQNQERKVQIEKKAIRICSDYFERLGYAVTSVETDNIGWDLNATSGRRSLRIEVKGLSGQEFSVELTPNEYHAFAQQKSDYRLAVVINALTSPALFICRYSKEYEAWIVEGSNGQTLDIKIIQSASITLTR
ncbi:MAG: DUF3883 domain-containing protein, partial [Rhodocyclales bacterium]|nr:DUF3883 domain-containing protein [Rhodocyclales bacterium]